MQVINSFSNQGNPPKKEVSLNLKPYFIVLSLFFLSACSQRFQDVNSTMAEALFGADDIALAPEKIKKLPYASAYVRINEGPQIFVVLAFAEANTKTGMTQYKWMSSDRAMIITENGRIVKTIGLFGDNLKSIQREQQTASSWKVTYDWMPDYRYGYQGVATVALAGKETVSTSIASYQTERYTESVAFDAIDEKLINTYWKDTTTGKVIKSVEQIGPEMSIIELTLLKQPTI
ncbi:YjbF family lipoprotein [Vibrio mediterranei]|nr:YjbF family lipoprotein [Vibrio mediterranei]